MTMSDISLESKLQKYGQEHLLRWEQELDERERECLYRQIDEIDFLQIQQLLEKRTNSSDVAASGTNHHAELAFRAKQPASLIRLPQTDADHELRQQAFQKGEELLRAGKVGAILVAGGQGSRLGFEHPKGMFPIGPVTGNPLFQILAEQLLARSRRANCSIPYFIMTSDATHEETVLFFKKNAYFQLNPADVFFFMQGTMPAVDEKTGRILLAEKGQIARSPDGHGGMLNALSASGMLEEMKNRGVEYLYYHQVDNPAAIVCDPEFLGLHVMRGSEFSTKVVAKRDPLEKMGVVVSVDGRTQILEYSNLPPDMAANVDENGAPLFWAGNTAIHLMNRSFLERLVEQENSLPFHLAHKKVPYINDNGNRVEPNSPNAFKFEKLIFDALPQAKSALVVETDRQREFHPVKNSAGNDSPETARAALSALFTSWLNEAGAHVAENVMVEVSPLFALDAEELKKQIPAGTIIEQPTAFTEETSKDV
ncbi:MAG: UDPGP type 1 family protein [Planctomycetaceae bacterium]